ncbi:MAG: metallophosphoesterase [Paracoccus sp. (in: a-proteobacteria)]|nr:metallophosphoesterase [Paracoccus sp. (in: a-proteobacteria)]
MGYGFTWQGLALEARGSGALWAAQYRALIAADLHLGRSLRSTRDGGLPLPPFESLDTLRRLAAEVAALNPARVYLLGDTLDAAGLGPDLPEAARAVLEPMQRDGRYVFLSGNHDAGGQGEARLGPVTLRHIAGEGPDISGHYHPKLRFMGRSYPVFLAGRDHLILPAFGTYTGGLFWSAPALQKLIPQGLAIIRAPRPFAVPLSAPKA